LALKDISTAIWAVPFLLVIPAKAMPLVVAVAMLLVAGFTLIRGKAGVSPAGGEPARTSEMTGYGLTFLLGIYGGFFSGGYVALLTAVMVGCFGMAFIESIAVTKLLNLFSSLVAIGVFAVRGLIDWKLGLILGTASFVGGVVGGLSARNLSDRMLRRVFLVTVVVLAVKTLLYDVHW
jgi:uncharacterized protein